ncbi:MAG TPA: carboxypeptidase-like regulatory domain-containing protein [bacterium]|nr:carboxypeptidase-like regulatory domain-containing protein [bacterium]
MSRAVVALAVLLLAVAAAAAPAPGPVAPVRGAIIGTVSNGRSGQPAGGQTLHLVFVGAQGPEQIAGTRTDAQGRFAFRGLIDGRYLVQTTHQGVSYAAHAVVNGGPVQTTLEVFDASSKVALRIAMLGLAVDVQPGYVRISEVVHIQNPETRTFIGDMIFPLPEGARYITYHEGLHRPSVDRQRITDRLIIRPGSHQVAYAYTVAGRDEIALDRALPKPVDRLELFTTAPAEARSPRLQSLPTVSNENRSYTRATGRAIPAGTLSLTIIGVPAPREWPAPAAAGTLAGLLTLGLGWAVASAARAQTARRS